MAKKKASAKQKAALGEAPAQHDLRRALGKDTPAAKWRRMAGLTGEALKALEAGNSEGVRRYLEAMRAVALCAAESESARTRRTP